MQKIVLGKQTPLVALAIAAFVLRPDPLFAAGEPDRERYIVKFRDAAQGKAVLDAEGIPLLLELGPQKSAAAHLSAQELQKLQSHPAIEYVEPDVPRFPSSSLWSDETSGGETLPFGIAMVEANQVAAGATNRKVCIIDSGYSPQHEDLKESDVTGHSDKKSGSWDKDSCGHGSHVAGTISAIAGNAKGVIGAYPQASLHIVKVFGDDTVADGNCKWTYSSNLVNALNQCVTAGADVVNMSLGGPIPTRTEKRAFAEAYAGGMLPVAAAGNDGNTHISYPAGYPAVVSVAAVDANEVKADFSQYNKDVEIAAPGVAVLSTLPWIDTVTLTSDGDTASGGHIDGAAWTDGYTNTIVDGGKCDSVTDKLAGAIVLCQRGDITFADKVDNVQKGGGGAVVIYNNVTSDATCGDFSGTLGDNTTSAIPAISVSCAAGATALGHIGQPGTVVSQRTANASGYQAWSGTSMATPHVSAVAALVWSHCPRASGAQVRDALNATADDQGDPGRDDQYGYGIVKAQAALDYLSLKTACD